MSRSNEQSTMNGERQAVSPGESSPLGQELRRLRRRLIVTWLVVVVAFGAGALCFISYSHSRFMAQATVQSTNVVTLLQNDIRGDLQVVESVFTAVAVEYPRMKNNPNRSMGELERYLAQQGAVLVGHSDLFRVADAGGAVLFGLRGGEQLNISDTSFFQSVKNSLDRKLYFSRPVRDSLTGGKTIYLAQRITGGGGEFLGIVYGGIDLDKLGKDLEKVNVGQSGSIILRDAEMRYLTRFPPLADDLDRDLTVISSPLRAALLSDPDHGTVIQRSPLDHIRRLASFAQIKPYPLVVIAGVGINEYFTPWYYETAFVGFGFVVLLSLSWCAVRRIIREEAGRLTAHHEMAHSNANFRDFFNEMSRMVIVLNSDDIILTINQYAADRVGYTERELVGERFERLFKDFSAEKATHALELTIVSKEGKVVPVGLTRVSGVWNDDRCQFVFLEDRTHVKATNDLAERLLRNTSQGIYGTDRNGICSFINEAALQLTGYQREECIGHNMHELSHHHRADGSYYPAIECAILATNRTGEPVLLADETLWRKDGTTFVAEIASHPVIEAGQLLGSVVTITDITVRRVLEVEQRKLQRAIEQCPVTIVITDIQGKLEYVNPYFTKMSGYGPDEAIGENQRILQSGLTPRETYRDLWDTLLSGNVWSGEFTNKDKSGNIYHEQANISPIFDGNGIVTHYLGVKEDITAKKLFMAQMVKAKEDAEAGNRAKSEFLATISHEIRTPMNGVVGMTEILLETELTAEQREFANIIRKSSDHMMGLITDIFDYSKINEYKLDLKSSTFDLTEMVTDCLQMQRMFAEEKGLELRHRIDTDVPHLLNGDPKRLCQIISNMVSNAIKFTLTGEISVSVKVKIDQLGLVVLLFEVTDSGIGISPLHCQKIFEPFTQADASNTRKYGGTGMGLALCRQITYLMGGDIGVTSEEGKGSTFWFTAMFERPTGEEADSVTAPVEKRSMIVVPAEKEMPVSPLEGTMVPVADLAPHDIRILLAEDNIINQKVALNLLGKLGYRTDVAGDGQAAVTALESSDYDLVLMDCLMPVMDGLAATAVIRDPASKVRNHGIPIIAVTANVLDSDRERCLGVGMNDYLSKPLKKGELAAAIERWLGKAP